MTNFFIAGHALIEREGRYLVIRRSKENNYEPLKWDLPGGIVKSGELIEDAIHREVKEETGLSVNMGMVVFVYTNIDQFPARQTFQIIYSCTYKNGKIRLNPSEHDKFQWLDYSDITYIDMIDFLKKLVTTFAP